MKELKFYRDETKRLKRLLFLTNDHNRKIIENELKQKQRKIRTIIRDQKEKISMDIVSIYWRVYEGENQEINISSFSAFLRHLEKEEVITNKEYQEYIFDINSIFTSKEVRMKYNIE